MKTALLLSLLLLVGCAHPVVMNDCVEQAEPNPENRSICIERLPWRK